jgi:serine/threonine-protein kinase HipA
MYDSSWLKNPERFALEPALTLTDGAFYTEYDKSMFGAIGDSAPDRWGRVLMRRAEFCNAQLENRATRTLSEMDYLLMVSDEVRQGALRFSHGVTQDFLALSNSNPIPPLIDLARLLSASDHFLDNKDNSEDLKLLLAPGSSLGGARPKASVKDKAGRLAIAKFPHKDDDSPTVLWEAAALTLASRAGIKVNDWQLEIISGRPVLIVRRFDRNVTQRIPFLSAMSMIGARDNEQHSYLELVDALKRHGAEPERDMVGLWRRIVFSILISNTDDHLRNHGFLYTSSKGWELSPAFDLNPTPITMKPRVLTTNIDLDNSTASLSLALSVAAEFGLNQSYAKSIIKEVGEAVKNWRNVAKVLGINGKQMSYMAGVSR